MRFPAVRLGLGVITGLVAASATAGALVAFGLRFGTPARPFNAIAALVLGSGAEAAWAGGLEFSTGATLLGLLLHTAFTAVLGVIYVTLVDRARGGWLSWSFVVAGSAFLLSTLTAAFLRAGLGALLPLGDRVVLAVVLAAALPLGMRFALSMRGGESDAR